MQYGDVLKKLKSLYNSKNVEGMARFGINPKNTYGISIPNLRKIAKEIGKDHLLAKQLWASGIHEAKILASMVDDPKKVTQKQMDSWIIAFDSWDVCDQCCMNLFDKTKFAYEKAIEWSSRSKEFEKRAGFTMMAVLSVHDKKTTDHQFKQFFPIIKREATDSRNFVKKAVNWALRSIGKRNIKLNQLAIDISKEIKLLDTKASVWIASNALNELISDNVQKRLKN